MKEEGKKVEIQGDMRVAIGFCLNSDLIRWAILQEFGALRIDNATLSLLKSGRGATLLISTEEKRREQSSKSTGGEEWCNGLSYNAEGDIRPN